MTAPWTVSAGLALALASALRPDAASATSIDPAWPDPVSYRLEDPWADPTAAPDLGGRRFGDMVRGRPEAMLDLNGVLHPTRAEAPPLPARPVDGFAADRLGEADRAARAPGAAPLDAKTGGAPLPWEAPSPSVFSDVLRNAPEKVAEDSRLGLRDPLVVGLVARASALPPDAAGEEVGGTAAAAAAAAPAPAPAPASGLGDRGPLLIILAILILMSATIMVVARPASPRPKLLTSRRFGH